MNGMTIELKFVETNVFTRWPCTICGGCTEKVNVLTEGVQPLSDDGEYRQIRVCERCLERGNIDGHLEQRAQRLEAEAALVREMIGKLKVPTFEEWKAREHRADVAWSAQHASDDVDIFNKVMNDDATFAEWDLRYTQVENRCDDARRRQDGPAEDFPF